MGGCARDPVESLSKGNQQKVQFAAAVLHGPRVALLDEPFSGLDPLNQELFSERIRALRDEGALVLLSAHQLQLVERVVDRLLVLAGGRVVLDGTVDELLRERVDGTRLVVRIGVEEVPPLPDALAGVQLERGGERVVLSLDADERLGDALAWVGARLARKALHTERPSLHDPYVRAVEEAR